MTINNDIKKYMQWNIERIPIPIPTYRTRYLSNFHIKSKFQRRQCPFQHT